MRPLLLFLIFCQVNAFAVIPNAQLSRTRRLQQVDGVLASNRAVGRPHCSLPRYRQTKLHGLFGLGFAELALIAIVVGFILGPDKILSLIRSTGSTAKEFKDEISKVPEEFKKGLEEGEIEARSRKAKPTRVVKDEEHK